MSGKVVVQTALAFELTPPFFFFFFKNQPIGKISTYRRWSSLLRCSSITYGCTNGKGRPTSAAIHLGIRRPITLLGILIRMVVSCRLPPLCIFDYLLIGLSLAPPDPNLTTFNYQKPKNGLVSYPQLPIHHGTTILTFDFFFLSFSPVRGWLLDRLLISYTCTAMDVLQ